MFVTVRSIRSAAYSEKLVEGKPAGHLRHSDWCVFMDVTSTGLRREREVNGEEGFGKHVPVIHPLAFGRVLDLDTLIG